MHGSNLHEAIFSLVEDYVRSNNVYRCGKVLCESWLITIGYCWKSESKIVNSVFESFNRKSGVSQMLIKHFNKMFNLSMVLISLLEFKNDHFQAYNQRLFKSNFSKKTIPRDLLPPSQLGSDWSESEDKNYRFLQSLRLILAPRWLFCPPLLIT